MKRKVASSQAGWALITGGVAAARVEAHRLHQLLQKGLQFVECSRQREHLYQVAGDLIVEVPRRVESLECRLDELAYALSIMGQDHLKDRLPLSRRNEVEESVEGAPGFGEPLIRHSKERRLARAVARRYLKGP